MSQTDTLTNGTNYQLVTKLGHGTMADVYLAFSTGIEGFAKLTVLKALRPDLAADEEFRARFLEEARLSMRLAHPNIVQTFEAIDDDTRSMIAMEYLEGQSLASTLNRIGRDDASFGFFEQTAILIEVLAALEYSHTIADFDGTPLHVVHRDISPPNIFLTYDGQVKVLDFGIAKALDSSIETRAGLLLGKARYMSPEQALGRDVDNRADLYSVAVMLWEAATGRQRWEGMPQAHILASLGGADAEPLPSLRDGTPEAIVPILQRALAQDPSDRYQTAQEFREALEEILNEASYTSDLRHIGRLVGDAFSSDRARTTRELERLLGDLNVAVMPQRAPGMAQREGALPAPHGTRRRAASLSPVSTGAIRLSLLQDRSRGWWALIAAAAIVGACAVYALSQRSPIPPPIPNGTGAPLVSSLTEPTPTAQVRVRVTVNPSHAIVTIDGITVGIGSLDIRQAKDDKLHRIAVTLPGHRSQVHRVLFDRDVSIEAQLERNTVEVAPPPEPAPHRHRAATTRRPAASIPAPAPVPESRPAPSVSDNTDADAAPRVQLDTRDPWH